MLLVYTLQRSDEWDVIVKSFDRYDVYYLSGYAKGFNIHGDGEPLLLYYCSDKLRGINVVMKRDIALDKHFIGRIETEKYYDLSTPYGYGGWLFEGCQNVFEYNSFKEEYLLWCQKQGIISEFVRFHPVLANVGGINTDFYEVFCLGNTVAVRLDNEFSVWERFSSKNRGHIRAAIKNGVTVRLNTSLESFKLFQKLYNATMDHNKASDYYYFNDLFFESIRNDLSENYLIFTAYLADQAIASSIMLYAGKYMSYHLSGQLFEYRKFAGTNLILYEAAKWGCNHGLDFLHLGGGLGAQDGPLYSFKKSFNTKDEDKRFNIGSRIINQKLYDEFILMRGTLPDGNFFPKYRA